VCKPEDGRDYEETARAELEQIATDERRRNPREDIPVKTSFTIQAVVTLLVGIATFFLGTWLAPDFRDSRDRSLRNETVIVALADWRSELNMWQTSTEQRLLAMEKIEVGMTSELVRAMERLHKLEEFAGRGDRCTADMCTELTERIKLIERVMLQSNKGQ